MHLRGEPEKRASVVPQVEGRVSKALDAIRDEAVQELKNFIKEVSRKLILTYAGPHSSPARYASLVLSSLTAVNSGWMHPQDLMYYTAPYDEGHEAGVVIFASDAGLNTLAMLIEQLVWTGHKVLIVTQHELPDTISFRIPEDAVIINLNTDDWLLTTHVLIARAIAEFGESKGVRLERLGKEASDVRPIIKDLLEEYADTLDRVREFVRTPTVVTASPTMWGPAEAIAYSNYTRTGRYLAEPEAVPQVSVFTGKVLIISTDVEEYSLKQIKSLPLTTSVKVQEVRLHTDPLTAPIYGIILVRALEYMR